MNIIGAVLIVGPKWCGKTTTAEQYANAFGFYVEKHKFKYLKKDQEKVDDIDRIIKINPERSFSLYKDIKSI